MARLPQPGGDIGTWGDVLNDFLSQSHNTDGTIKQAALDGRIDAKIAAQAAVDAAQYGAVYKDIPSLLAATKPAIGAGTLWRGGNYSYSEAASNAVDQHITTAGGVKLYVLPKNGSVELAAWGVDGTTPSVNSQLLQAAAIAERIILPPATTLAITSKVLLDADLIGTGDSWITMNISSGDAIEFTTGHGFDNVNFTSPYQGPVSSADAVDSTQGGKYDYGARTIRLNAYGFARNFELKYAAAGILSVGTNTVIENFNIHDIHEYRGWGAAIHRNSTSGSYGIVRNGMISNCDRGTETETGASYNLTENVTYTHIGPFGYSGQGAYEVYTFVLDAHSHDTEAPCIGNVYRHCRVIDSMGGITAVRSSGTSDSNMPRDNIYEDIEISGYTGTAGYEAVYLQGHNNRARVRFTAGSGITPKMHVLFADGGSDSNEVIVDRADTFALPLVQVGTTNASSKNRVSVAEIGTPSLGTGPIVDVYGPDTVLDLSIVDVVNTAGYLTVESSATGTRTRRFDYSVKAGETFASVITLNGTSDVDLAGIRGTNNEATVLDIVSTGGVLRGRASGIISKNTAVPSVSIGGATAQFDTARLDTTLGTIVDAGTNTRIARHGQFGYIGTIADPTFAAFVDAQSTTAPITWPSANLGIGGRVRINRRSSLTRFRFKVVTQSGNYYAAVCDTTGKVLWKTVTTLPAAGVQSLTMTGVEVQPGDELVLFLALSSATAAVAGMSLLSADQNLIATVKGAPHAVSVANLYTTNTAVGSTISLGSTLPSFQPLITLIET